MASKKGFVKLLALGAVLGGVAAMMHGMKDKHEKVDELEKAAKRIKDKMAKHAKTLGHLTKEAYGTIVDATVSEYRGMKALSEDELKDMSKELKASWKDVKEVMKKPAKKSGKK